MKFLSSLILLLFAVSPAWALTEAEIQKFIDDAIKAGGGEVVIPPGVHVIERGLVVKDAKKLRIVGLDAEKTVLQAKSTKSKEIAILKLIGADENTHLEKLTFKDGDYGVLIQGPDETKQTNPVLSSLTVRRCFFEGQSTVGLLLQGAPNFRIEECSLRSITLSAVLVLNGSDTAACVITRNFITRCHDGLSLLGVKKMSVSANEISDCDTGIFIGTAPSGNPAFGNQITNNALTRCKNAIIVQAEKTTVEQNEIVE